jgi:FKBP-type peptidyl-prolyl cis-trans isomerase 2
MSKVKIGDNINVHYTGKLEDGTVFDSSILQKREPLKATVGNRQLIEGFDNALIGMSVGDKKTVSIEPNQAYGPVRPEMIGEVIKSNLPPDLEVGQMLQAQTPQGPLNVRVVEIKEDYAILDGNHPLAGKTLIFDLELVSID